MPRRPTWSFVPSVAALVVAAALAVPSASSADDGGGDDDGGDPGLLCRIADLLNPVLDCEAGKPPPPPPPPSGGSEEAPPPSQDESGQPPDSVAPAGLASGGTAPLTVPSRPQYVANQLLVRFAKGATKREIAAVLERAGVKLDETIGELGVRVVRVPPARRQQALARLRSSPLVDTAERDAKLWRLETRPNDLAWPEQWGLHVMGLPAAWDLSRGSSNLVVAVLDTGVDGGHPDLAGAVLPGVDLVNGDGDAADDQGHGTAVAGIVAARTNNAQGQAGICWTCSILPVKVLDSKGAGSMSVLADGIVQAVERGARVVNMSLGGPAGSETLERAVSYALSRGVVLVAAAGNNGTSAPFYPAAYPGVLGVAGADDADKLYPWSNRGPSVHLAAPGCNVGTTLGGLYDHICGTSTAAPLVAGVAALALSAKPSASRAEIESAFVRSAVGMEGGVARINAAGMLSALGVSALPAPAAASSASTLTGTLTTRSRTRIYPIATASGRLTAMLTFKGKKPLTLSVVDAAGALLGRVSGKSPLRLAQQVPAGELRVVVSGRAPASFVLKLGVPAAPPAPG